MRRISALVMVAVVALSLGVGGVAAADLEASENTVESDEITVTANASASELGDEGEYGIYVYDAEGDATPLDSNENGTADTELTATLNVSGYSGDSVYVAVEDASATSNQGELSNQTVTFHNVSVTVDDQETSDNATVDVDVDGEYELLVTNEDGDELHNETVDANTSNVTVDVSEELANNDTFNMTASLETTGGAAIDGASDTGEITLESTGGSADEGGLLDLGDVDLPVVGSVPILYILIAVLALLAAGVGAAYYRGDIGGGDGETMYID